MRMMIERIYLEVTTRCNYRCAYCPHPTMARAKEHIDDELAALALEQIASGGIGDTVNLNYLGEPLLYPGLVDVIERAHGLGLKTHVTTNGSLLSPPMIERLRASHLSSIKISHDSSKDDVAAVHGAPAFPGPRILAHIEGTLRAFDRAKPAKRVTIILMTTKPGFAKGIDGLDIISTPAALVDEARTIHDVVARTCTDAVRPWHVIEAALAALSFEIDNPLIPLARHAFLEVRPTLAWEVHQAGQVVVPALRGTCDGITKQIGILRNGDVVPCCVDSDGELVLGNIREQRLHTILRGARAREIRAGFANGRVVERKCQQCLGTPLPRGAGAGAGAPAARGALPIVT